MLFAYRPKLAKLPVFFSLSLTFLATACGGAYETVKVKHYRLALVDGDPALKADFRQLVSDFNSYAGIEVLDFLEDSQGANSAIIVTKGLEEKTRDPETGVGHVGEGQWLSETETDGGFAVTPGSKTKRTVTYSMRIEFDWDYFHRYRGLKGDDLYKKQKLFFHEVGHGLEMDHALNDQHDVMYGDVSVGDQKNFDGFFTRVRDYMAD